MEIWTDGSCDNDNGVGGWAYVIVQEGKKILQVSDGDVDTTNNRMEMAAVIEGLKHPLCAGKSITVVSDSAYVINCFKQKWYVKWLQNGWISSSGLPVKNMDLWKQLINIVIKHEGRVSWRHERGHQKKGLAPFNDLADSLADSARRRLIEQMNLNDGHVD